MALEVTKNPRDIIYRPIVSEKAYGLMDLGKYTFEVDPKANKTEIRIAIEKIFDVKVKTVNTIARKGKRYVPAPAMANAKIANEPSLP